MQKNSNKTKIKKASQIKTIDYNAKEWRDKTYGNTYFSSQLILNYGMANQETIYIPFQYGDSRHGESVGMREITGRFNIGRVWLSSLEEQGIIVRTNIETKCRQKDVKAFGKED